MLLFLPNLGMGGSPFDGGGDGGGPVTYYSRRRGSMRWQPYIGALVMLLWR